MSDKTIEFNGKTLQPLLLKPTVLGYVQQLYNRRFFIVADAKGKAFRTTRDYAFWRIWLVLLPIFDILIYAFIFGFILKTSRGVESFLSFLVIGVIFFGFMSQFLTAAVGVIQVNKNLIDSFNFPRAAVVFSHALRYFLDNLIPALIAVVGALLLKDTVSIPWTVLLVVPLYLLLHLFGLGLMLIVARLTAFRPEVKVVVNLFSRAWFFLSGVFFSIERFVDHEAVQQIMMANPAYKFLTAIRDCVVYDTAPSWSLWGGLIAWSVGLFLVGFVFFWQAEEKYVNVR